VFFHFNYSFIQFNSSLYILSKSESSVYSFTIGLFFTVFAQVANLKVERV
jgi:hypothetical protein